MARIKKPCVRCESMERYSNGGCKPCQKIKQRARNRALAIGKGKILTANGNARREARSNNQKIYEKVDCCPRCNSQLYYTSGGNCIDCNYLGAPDNPDNKPRPFVQQITSFKPRVGGLYS